MKSTQLLLLTAPPASGKTFWIESYASAVETSVLVISPLRALADECHEKWRGKIKIMTPEEWITKPCLSEIVIFDEFHLNFYWGDTFRPLLWEVFYELAHSTQLCILLTATFSKAMQEEVRYFTSHFDEVIWCDLGNQHLKFPPRRYLKAPSRDWIGRYLLSAPKKEGVSLIFCAYRAEVFQWEKKLKLQGYRVWTCVGGESQQMRKKMASEDTPDFIIATKVLSHGVNLPAIRKVYFLYAVGNLDFWIQMVARGGRKGEDYEVMALENPQGIKWNPWTNYLAILLRSFTMKSRTLIEQGEQWFLKESS